MAPDLWQPPEKLTALHLYYMCNSVQFAIVSFEPVDGKTADEVKCGGFGDAGHSAAKSGPRWFEVSRIEDPHLNGRRAAKTSVI